ncbi:MAG TPA: efflux RND transporter periplasmic adaptor subunit [Bacteroidales bacterium]|nr:efflux RND transporter periplasmic adaptor subunit [Bacteroidales bacterium]
MKKRSKTFLWVALILIVGLIIALPKLRESKKEGKGAGSKSGRQQAVVVKVLEIKPSTLRETVKTSGTLLADEEVDLSFEASGKIEKILFKEGTQVRKGQILAELNNDDLIAQLGKLQLQNKLLSEKVNRQKILLEKEAISQESYDQMMTDLQSNEAEIKLLQVNISKRRLPAPFDGVIGLRFISEGAYVNPSTKVAKLIKTQPLKIEFSIPERYAEIVKTGYNLTFNIENSTERYAAKVYAIEPSIDAKTRALTLRAYYDNPGNKLNPGRYVSVELIIREKKDAIQVPTEAVVPELGGEKVFIVKNGKAQMVDIQAGLRTEQYLEITEGVNPGDSVVVSGVMQLRSDIPVIIAGDKPGKDRPKRGK